MKRNPLLVAYLAVLAVLNVSCIDFLNNILNNTAIETSDPEVGLTGGPGAYVAGVNTGNGVCWKDGVTYYLEDASYSEVHAIFVTKKDVYLVGRVERVRSFDSYMAPVYWKNGARHLLKTNDNAEDTPRTIWVDGNNVYIIGTDKSGKPIYWKNGVRSFGFKQTYYDGESPEVVSSGVVYKAGSIDSSRYRKPVYWRNGVVNKLKCTLLNGVATYISVVGDKVYVVGHEYSNDSTRQITCWTNGTERILSDGLHKAYERSAFVKDGIMYVAGYEEDRANKNRRPKYWKSNQALTIDNITNVFYPSCIFVK